MTHEGNDEVRLLKLENQRLRELLDRVRPVGYQDGIKDCIDVVQRHLTVSNMFDLFKRSLLRELECLRDA